MRSGGLFAKESGTFRLGTASSTGVPRTSMFRSHPRATTSPFMVCKAMTTPEGQAEFSAEICWGHNTISASAGLSIKGTLQQSLWMNEVVLSLGVSYDGASMYGPR